jgi:hypothetical protein
MPVGRASAFIGLCLVSFICASYAQSPLVTVTPGRTDKDGLPESDAKVCLNQPPHTCYAIAGLARDPARHYFAFKPHAKVFGRPGPEPWILADATYSVYGAGAVTRFDILRSEDTYLVDVLPVELNSVNEHALWRERQFSPLPLFVDAELIWANGEPHFGRHFFTVDVWRYDPREREYFRIVHYRSPRKYKLGHATPIKVLSHERHNILLRLSHLPNAS